MDKQYGTSTSRSSLSLTRPPFVWLFFALGASLLCGCHSRAKKAESIEVEVRQVSFDHSSNSPVVILQDKEKTKILPIWIGTAEAQAIALQLQGVEVPRPLTHDLLKAILEQTGILVDRVLVTEMKGSTYYARIYLQHGERTLEMDSRPSDAIALALRLHRPIFVESALFAASPSLEHAEPHEKKEDQPSFASMNLFGVVVQDLTDDLAVYFDLPSKEGVLIADIKGTSKEHTLQRGDVILAIRGKKIRNVEELRKLLEKPSQQAVEIKIRREGRDLETHFPFASDDFGKEKEKEERKG